MAKIQIKHDSGITKEIKQGFSWTIFFFGIFALAFRGQTKEMWIAIVILLVSAWWTFGIIYGIYLFFLAFTGNKKLLETLLLSGYRIVEGQ